jgi:hypothetical protein
MFQEKAMKEFADKTYPGHHEKFEKILSRNKNKGFLVGDKVGLSICRPIHRPVSVENVSTVPRQPIT